MELEALRSGNDTGNILWINQENMYIVDEQQIQNIYNKVNGLQANSFEGMSIIDPAIDLGDKIIINGKSVIYQGGLDFQGRFIANIKSKIALKQKQETTIKQVSQKNINRRVESNINQIEGKITQLAEENSETSKKLTKHEQDINSITDTVSNVKTNLEENYFTTEEINSKITQEADDITSSVNKKITEIQVDADNLLLNTALKKDASNFNLANGVTRVTDKITPNNNYCFKYNISGLTADAWRSANPTNVNLNAGEIVTASANVYVPSGVTNSDIKIEIQFFKADGTRIKTFTNAVDLTKTNIWQRISVTGTAPADTVKANARVWILRNGQCWVGDLKLGRGNTATSWCPSSKDYPTVKEFGTLVEHNWEHVKVAWNTICEYLQLENLKGNASLVVRDENGNLIMSLDKTGQHYWTKKDDEDKNIAETTLKDITINNQTKKALMFILDNEEMNGEGIMAWGYKNGDNISPVLYVGNFGDEEFGLHLATDLIAHAHAIKFQNASIDDDGVFLYLRILGGLGIMDVENNTWIAQLFLEQGTYGFSIKADDFSILDSSAKNVLISMYTNEAEYKNIDHGNNDIVGIRNLYTDGQIQAKDNIYSDKSIIATGSVYGNNITSMINCDYFNVSSGGSGGLSVRDKTTGEQVHFTGDWKSDARLKKDIKSANLHALELIKKIEHREFAWKEGGRKEKIGYIAQELEEIDSNFVKKYEVKDNDDKTVDYDYTINERFIISLLTKSIQEQQEIIDKQQQQIEFLMKKVDKQSEFKFVEKIRKHKDTKKYGEKVVVKRIDEYKEKKKEMLNKKEVKLNAKN